jgi:hypothetical protein
MFIITNGRRYGQRYGRMKNLAADLDFHSSREATQKSQKSNIFRHFSRGMEFQVGRARFIGRFIFFERGKGTT